MTLGRIPLIPAIDHARHHAPAGRGREAQDKLERMAAVLAEVAEEKAELEESVLVLGRKVATLEGGTLNAPLSFIAGA